MKRILTLLVFSLNSIRGNSETTPVIALPDGKIRGEIHYTYRQNLPFSAFLGIPYAAPPIGKYRFQPPQPVQNWNGILDTNSNSKICYQTGIENANASEDCLYLNVYSPLKPTENRSLAVMLFIHGGTFKVGSAPSGFYDPQFLLEKNVIVVTINYRIGPFGFLSTGDEVIPGNMGLKDQQYALRWVQRNIHLFGGDSEKVTLTGQSAGSASVSYHLISKSSAGLFRGAIGMSGSALNNWAYVSNGVEKAYGIAAEIDPNFSRNHTTEELLDFLQSVDAGLIHATGTNSKYSSSAPVIEVQHDGAMITESMFESVKNGRINRVPYLAGICSEEAIGIAAERNWMVGCEDLFVSSLTDALEDVRWSTLASHYDENLSNLVDTEMYITNETIVEEAAKEIKVIYTNDTFVEDIGAFTQYISDDTYARAPIKYAQLHSQYANVYFYQFSYHGEMGDNKYSIEGIGKVGHSEDLRYFWSTYESYDSFPESDLKTLDRYVTLMTNFVKFMNPTPERCDLFDNTIWPKITKDHFYYMDIGQNLSITEDPRSFSYRKWGYIFDKYARKPFISY